MSSSPPGGQLRQGLSVLSQLLLGGGLIVGLLTSVVQCHNERESARIASVQTYNLGRAATFRDSGAELDKKIAALMDVAAEGGSLKEARAAFRVALADHAARTFAMEDAFGAQQTGAYTASLRDVQAQVEATKDATNAGRVLTAMSKMLVKRKALADRVTSQATA